MSEIAIRRLSAANRHDYRNIRLEALRSAPEAFGSTHASEAERPIEAFEERLASSVVLGAYRHEEIVGMVGLAREPGPKERHKAFLWGMYVRSDMAGRGVGAALVEAILEQAPPDIEQITLAVVQDNKAAVALYQRVGFTAYGTEPRALKIEDRYFDEILMVKFLWADPAGTE
jgi:ribosomal protein S18 acetylase RimI-like enzyme